MREGGWVSKAAGGGLEVWMAPGALGVGLGTPGVWGHGGPRGVGTAEVAGGMLGHRDAGTPG